MLMYTRSAELVVHGGTENTVAGNQRRTAAHECRTSTLVANGLDNGKTLTNKPCCFANLEVRHSSVREGQRALAIHAHTP